MQIQEITDTSELTDKEMTELNGGITFSPIVIRKSPHATSAEMTIDWGGSAGTYKYWGQKSNNDDASTGWRVTKTA